MKKIVNFEISGNYIFSKKYHSQNFSGKHDSEIVWEARKYLI